MGLKENFYQALRELLNRGDPARSDSNKKANSSSVSEKQFASFDQDISKSYENVFAEFNSKPVENKSNDFNEKSDFRPTYDSFSAEQPSNESSDFNNRPNLFSKSARIVRPAPINQSDPADLPAYFNRPNAPGQSAPDRSEKEMSIISKNTVVFGDIRSLADVTINGKVRGNVDVLKDVSMHGMLVGNLRCNNTRMEGSSIQGNVMSKGSTYIHNDSVLLGNLTAQNSNVDGKVKGNMDVGSRAYLHQNAIIVGDINTNSIAVEDGANIKGFVNTAFLFDKGSAPFPNEVIIENDDINIGDSDI